MTDTLPSEWFPGAVEVDNSGVFIALADTPADTIVWHWCAGLNRWDGAYIVNHTIVSHDPLTITASLACRDCAWHGFITEGRWMPQRRRRRDHGAARTGAARRARPGSGVAPRSDRIRHRARRRETPQGTRGDPVTILQRLATPKPFVRLTRADYEKLLDRLYEDRDRAEGALRADRDRVAALIEQAADAHQRDAEHLDRLNGRVKGLAVEQLTASGHRAVECALRDVARDVAEGA